MTYTEEPLLRLSLASADRYPMFVAELQEATGLPTGWSTAGTLVVALDAGDRAVLADLHAFQTSLGLSVERLTRRQCRRMEPLLDPAVSGGLHAADDHAVDPRRLVVALLAAGERAGVRLLRRGAARLRVERARGGRGGPGAAGRRPRPARRAPPSSSPPAARRPGCRACPTTSAHPSAP